MSYNDELDELPEPVSPVERILSASDDMRNMLNMHSLCEGLRMMLGPSNYLRVFEYLDCIEANAPKLRTALEDALSQFSRIADGCQGGTCDPDDPCDHCIALGWIENNAGVIEVESTKEDNHDEHGRGSTEGGPHESDCPCRTTEKRAECAAAGCGFCRAASDREDNHE